MNEKLWQAMLAMAPHMLPMCVVRQNMVEMPGQVSINIDMARLAKMSRMVAEAMVAEAMVAELGEQVESSLKPRF